MSKALKNVTFLLIYL